MVLKAYIIFIELLKEGNNITPKHYQNHQLSMKGSIPASEKTFSLDGLSLENDFSGTMEVIDGEIVFHGSNSSWSEFLGYDATELKVSHSSTLSPLRILTSHKKP